MRPIARPSALLSLALVTGLALAAGCRPAPDAGPEPAEPADAPAAGRVENGALGLALARVPAGFEVARNEGEELVLVRRAKEDAARLTFELGPLQTAGVNLVEKVWEEKARIEALPEGEYRGQNELGGVPLGTTFTSRGRFRDESGEWIEEYRALLVHPTQNRALILDYEYPVPPPEEERRQNRLEELMQVLEQVEPIFVGETSPPPEGSVPAPPAAAQP